MTWNTILVASHTQFLLQNVLEDICCSKFARNVKYCSNVAQSAKRCLRVLKMQNSAPNSKKCSKGAQRNRERPNWVSVKRGVGAEVYLIFKDCCLRVRNNVATIRNSVATCCDALLRLKSSLRIVSCNVTFSITRFYYFFFLFISILTRASLLALAKPIY